jgi:hypothetical protein
MPPKKNTKRKDPPPPAEEGATDPANEVAEPPPSDNSGIEFPRVDFPRDDNDWQAIVAASTAAAAASAAVVARAAMSTTLMFSMLQQPMAQRMKTDYWTLPRNNRRDFWHGDALRSIQRDYTGLIVDPRTPLLGSEFKLLFRLSRGRFRVLMEEDFTASNYWFFKASDNDGFSRSSMEA